MNEYNHKQIEEKWRKIWIEQNLYKTEENPNKPKSYVLDMFPYPSGDGLHVGHPKGYIATDIYSRMKRMQGHNVLHPMGWDAFGLPAEQYALKNKIHPRIAVEKNIANFKAQLSKIGFSYDWERELNTTDPDFYKWTQWIFKQIYKKGLAYESHEPINWCPSCKTGLSNEDLDGDQCERCGTKVEKKPLRQWVLAITKYADRMLDDIDKLHWPGSIKESQRNWIGRNQGVTYRLKVKGTNKYVEAYSTHYEAFYADTFAVIASDHPKLAELLCDIKQKEEILARAKQITELRMKAGFNTEQLCEGVFTELYLEDPITGKDLPLWVSSYALAEYGTGIIKCSAHDERDFAFAKKYQLPLHTVLLPLDPSLQEGTKNFEICFTDFANATIIEPKEFFGKKPHDVREHIANYLEKMKWGNKSVQYKLKDWVFARQRYWGEPFPIVFDANHKPYVVADSELPVRLPQVEEYEPTGTGESPLANIREWVEVFGQINDDGEFETLDKTDPRAKPFTRETNTMPQWAGSSWYYLRYIDPKNSRELISKDKDKKWSPVDFYVGGAEHATRHLIYARFWHKFLYDIGVVNYDEPFTRLQNVGLILAEDGRKMSKRWGNVINPDDMVDRFGADTLRMYEMFMGPFDQAIAWSTESMMGSRRFIEKVWDYVYAWESGRVTDGKIGLDESQKIQAQKWREEVDTLLHKTIKKVGDDIEQFKFNTAISSLMIFINKVRTELPLGITPSCALTPPQLSQFLRLLAPFAPHITEELWQMIGESGSIHTATWPSYDEQKLITSNFTVAIQINGKLRDTIEITANMGEQEVLEKVRERSIIKKWIGEKNVVKYIYIENKLVNIVVSN